MFSSHQTYVQVSITSHIISRGIDYTNTKISSDNHDSGSGTRDNCKEQRGQPLRTKAK